MEQSFATTPSEADVLHVLAHTGALWEEFRESSVFVTGGTGFFGKWLLLTFAAANLHFGLRAKCTVLTRDAESFRRSNPGLSSQDWLSTSTGDVRSFSGPDGHYSHVIHAATPASAALIQQQPLEMFDIIVTGTRRVLDFAARCGARKLLLCSSGAVYGRQPTTVERIAEDHTSGPDPMNPGAAYAEGKRVSEFLSVAAAAKSGIEIKVARGFAFAGPYLPMDIHFAIGNFIRDSLAGQPVIIRGDGTPLRSYLYAADLMIWLWTILAHGAAGRAYNVGSEHAISIADLARVVVRTLGADVPVQILGTPQSGRLPDRYIPSTMRAQEELGLKQHISLEDAIRRTAEWARRRDDR